MGRWVFWACLEVREASVPGNDYQECVMLASTILSPGRAKRPHDLAMLSTHAVYHKHGRSLPLLNSLEHDSTPFFFFK